MFFIFWGSNVRMAHEGFVADLCILCRRVSSFKVISWRETFHIYWIPLGKGSIVAGVLRCNTCGSEQDYDTTRFSHIVSHREARTSDLLTIVRLTNPSIEHLLARSAIESTELPLLMASGRARVQNDIRDLQASIPGGSWDRDSPSPPDSEPEKSLATLRGMQDSQADALRASLREWQHLQEAARETLLADLDRYHADCREFETAERFLRGVMDTRPRPWGAMAAAGLVVLAILAAARFGHSGAELLAACVLGAVVGMACKTWLDLLCSRKWCETTLLPRARDAGVNPESVSKLLDACGGLPLPGTSGTIPHLAPHARALKAALARTC